MKALAIGDFVCLQNHPYFDDNQKIKIAANADMTPPVMIIGEILDKDECNPLNGKQSEIQIRCYYYSTKDGKYIDKWFKSEQVKKLEAGLTYLDNEVLKSIDDFDLEYIKKLYVNTLVCLKSVDFELNKKKIFIDSSDGIRTNKENNHLEFLPPVMTVIDIIKNKEEKKFSTTKPNFVEKNLSKYVFKCKWYNPKISSYSEEFLPSNVLGTLVDQQSIIDVIISSIDQKQYLILKLRNSIHLEENTTEVLTKLVEPHELIFNHYYYKLNATDLFKQKVVSFSLDEIYYENNKNQYSIYSVYKSLILGHTFPRFGTRFETISEKIFEETQYFLITYRDKNGKVTIRMIKVITTESYIDATDIEHNFVVANCLLRNGNIRHFKINQITKVTKILNGVEVFENL